MSKNRSGRMTPVGDATGIAVQICVIDEFDNSKRYTIANAPATKEAIQFDGTDLNYLARVLFAEASGSVAIPDLKTRAKEKLAIVNVMYNRINVVGFDPNSWIHGKFTTFKGVASAVKAAPNGHFTGVQFASVIGTDGSGTPKFKSVEGRGYESLNKADCNIYNECFNAIKSFLASGPDSNLDYDNFRASDSATAPDGQVIIGGNRFWKMK